MKVPSMPETHQNPSPLLFNRRDALRVGSLTLSASVLPGLSAEAQADPTFEMNGKAKSVIFLWMGGGVTHIDSFDPKPEAPEQIRGTLSSIDTALPGVQFAEPMKELAKIADDLAVVRSYSHGSNDHFLSQVHTLSGRKVLRTQLFQEPNIGAILSYLYGPRNGLPGYIAVPGTTFPGPPPTNLFVGGWLGNQYAPFAVGGRPEQPDFTKGPGLANPSTIVDEKLNPKELTFPEEMTLARLSRRTDLKTTLEQAARNAEKNKALATMDGHYQSAMNLLTSEKVRSAFDITKETVATRDTYGRTKIGGRCLMARRLVEKGARFVMVDYGYDLDYGNLWDQHNAASQNLPHVSEMCMRGYHLVGVDKAFAALVTDLKQRGMLDSTLVVFLTEFGRTPKINANGGRDHWGACGSMFFTGAGTQVGQVVGASDKQAAYPITRSYSPSDIAATIYSAIGLDTEHRITDARNLPHKVLDHGQPILEVL